VDPLEQIYNRCIGFPRTDSHIKMLRFSPENLDICIFIKIEKAKFGFPNIGENMPMFLMNAMKSV
jgi:hypothetical protein